MPCPLIIIGMALSRTEPDVNNNRRQARIIKDQSGVLGIHIARLSWPSVGKQPRSIQKQAIRKSARLKAIQQLRKQSISKSDLIWEVQAPLTPPISNHPEGRNVCASTAPNALSYRWPNQGTIASTNPPQTFESPKEIETETRIRNWIFLSLKPRLIFFEATANLAFKLYC